MTAVPAVLVELGALVLVELDDLVLVDVDVGAAVLVDVGAAVLVDVGAAVLVELEPTAWTVSAPMTTVAITAHRVPGSACWMITASAVTMATHPRKSGVLIIRCRPPCPLPGAGAAVALPPPRRLPWPPT